MSITVSFLLMIKSVADLAATKMFLVLVRCDGVVSREYPWNINREVNAVFEVCSLLLAACSHWFHLSVNQTYL